MIRLLLLILKLSYMGCSQSASIMQNPKKLDKSKEILESPPPTKPKAQQKLHYLLGHIGQSQHLFAKVSVTNRSLTRLALPPNFQPYNFSSMLQLDPKSFLISGGINFSLTEISSQAFIYDGISHTIKELSNMNQARYTHAATLFKEAVYVIGGRYFGEDQEAILKSCERYSFGKDEWIVMPNLNIKRCTCYAIIWKGEMYVIGGYTGTYERSEKIEKFNQTENRWEIMDFCLNRGIESAFLLPTNNNEVTIFGGNTNSGSTSSVSTINFFTKSIVSHKSLRQRKTLHKSFIYEDAIFIFGGSDKLSLQIYDFRRKDSELIDLKLTSQFKPETFQVLTMSQATLNLNFQPSDKQQLSDANEKDEIILIFGTTQQPFILQINVSVPSSQIHSVPLSLKLFANSGGVNLANLSYILFGGIQDDSLSYVSNQVFHYDHLTKKVKKLNSMTTPRYSFTYQKIGGKIFVFGGGNSDVDGNLDILDDCEYYQIDKDTWKSICNLPIPLISSMSLVYNSNIYVFGGIMNNKARNKAIYKYQPEKDTWNELIFHLPFGIQSAFVYSFKSSSFYIFGGRLDNGDTDGIWQLIFVKEGSSNAECSLFQKGTTVEKKSGLKIFKPEKQDFFVSFGGKKEIVNYYDVSTVKVMQWDGLRRLKQVFMEQIQGLNSATMENYLAINKQY